MSALLEVSHLNLEIQGRKLLRALNWRVQAGERWVILGRNGAGKSQLLNTLAGLQASSGEIRYAGQPLQALSHTQRAQHFGLLFQHSSRGLYSQTAEMVLGGVQQTHYWTRPSDRAAASQAIERFDLQAHAHKPLDTLSGGELRRAEIARLWVQNPTLALLDEPSNHLDLGQQRKVLEQLQARFSNAQQAMVAVLHDLQLTQHIATHLLLLLEDGQWRAGPVHELATAELLSRALGHPIALHPISNRTLWLAE